MLTGVLVTVMALSVVGAATGHVVLASRSTPEYDAMRSDPLAAERLPGLAVRFDWSKDATTPFGMRSPAQVSRLWTITDGSAPAAKVAELGALAERNEWVVAGDPTFCGWRKSIDGHPLCLVVRPGPAPDEVVVKIIGGRAAPALGEPEALVHHRPVLAEQHWEPAPMPDRASAPRPRGPAPRPAA